MNFMRLAGLFFISALSINTQMACAQDGSNDALERQVKSAYIFKFGNYIAWPDNLFADANSPIIIGVVDDELLASELERVAAGHKTGNRSVIIKKLNAKDMNTDVHILYVANDASKLLNAYRSAHPQVPTLYITDTTEGLAMGSIINFAHDNNRLRFDVSLRAAEQNKIKLDASLLTVARQVINK